MRAIQIARFGNPSDVVPVVDLPEPLRPTPFPLAGKSR
jgi:hypothetical protein